MWKLDSYFYIITFSTVGWNWFFFFLHSELRMRVGSYIVHRWEFCWNKLYEAICLDLCCFSPLLSSPKPISCFTFLLYLSTLQRRRPMKLQENLSALIVVTGCQLPGVAIGPGTEWYLFKSLTAEFANCSWLCVTWRCFPTILL